MTIAKQYLDPEFSGPGFSPRPSLSPWPSRLLFTTLTSLWCALPVLAQLSPSPIESPRNIDPSQIANESESWRELDAVPIQPNSPELEPGLSPELESKLESEPRPYADQLAPLLTAPPPKPVLPVLPTDQMPRPSDLAPSTAAQTLGTMEAAPPLLKLELRPWQSNSPTPNSPANGRDAPLGNYPWLEQPYTLTVGDRLGIVFQNIPEYTTQYQVQLDGSLNLPVIGPLPVWGLTLSQVEQRIEEVYAKADVLRHPSVTVSLLAMAPLRIAVTGEVARPGSYRLPPADVQIMPTVTEALQQAGGITQRTNLQKVHIDRRLPSGQLQRLTVNLWQLLQSGDLTQDIALRDGDSLILETAPPLEISQAMALGNANVAQKAVRVGIWGETQQAGTFEVPPNTPLNQVLLAAGGFNERAQQKTVDLIRLNPNGTVSQETIRIDLSASVTPEQNPIIQDRDIIRVHPTHLFRASDRVNQAISPLTNTVSTVLQPVTSLFSVMNIFQLFSSFFGSTK